MKRAAALKSGRVHYAWKIRWRNAVARQTLCRLGRHDDVTAWRRGESYMTPVPICARCLTPRD